MRRRGFTLIELLVAVALGALLLTLTTHVFRVALLGRERLVETGRQTGALRRAYETISRDLHSTVVPPDDSGLQFGLSATGAGAGNSVLQLASVVGEPLLVERPSSETVLVQYAVAEDPRSGKSTLWRYETPYPIPEGADTGPAADTRSIPLLAGVAGVTYLFYSWSEQTWLETWEDQPGLPAAIRMDLALQDTAAETEPRLESWVFAVPGGPHASEEAAAAAGEGESQ